MNSIYVIVAFSLSIFLHELAHWMMLIKYGVKPKLEIHSKYIGISGYQEGLKFSQKGDVLLYGMLAGIIPMLFINPYWLFLYAYLCHSDILAWLTVQDYRKRFGDLYLIDSYALVS